MMLASADNPVDFPYYLPKPLSTYSHPFGECLVVTRSGLDCLFLLNGSGRLIWEGLEEGATDTELAERLAIETDVALDSAKEQLRLAFEEWEQQGLLGAAKPSSVSGPTLPSAGSSQDPSARPPAHRVNHTPQFTLWFRFLGKVIRLTCHDSRLASAIRLR